MIRQLLALLALTSLAWGEPTPPAPVKVSITKFLGLNTVDPDFAVGIEYARKANNVDFSLWGNNSIGGRKGYDSVSARAGQDSMTSLTAYYYRDGNSRLVATFDSTGIGYGGVYATAKNAHSFLGSAPTKLWPYWSPSGITTGKQWLDRVFLVNANHRGLVILDTVTRPWPVPSPSEPLIYPIAISDSTSQYKLTGEYRYTISACSVYAGSAIMPMLGNYVSQPIRVYKGRVLLTGFVWPQRDSVTSAAVDSVKFRIFRTKRDPGALDESDTVFCLAGSTAADSVKRIKWYSGTLDANAGDTITQQITFIDSIPDSLLQSSSTYKFIPVNRRGPLQIGGRDSTAGYDFRPYGGVSIDSIKLSDSGGATTIFKGIPKQRDTMGVIYFVTYIDTVSGFESGLSNPLYVMNDTVNASHPFDTVYLSVPAAPIGFKGYVRNLYRSTFLQIGRDTQIREEYLDTNVRLDPFGGNKPDTNVTTKSRWLSQWLPDTSFIAPPYLIGQIGSSTNKFADAIPYDSLIYLRRYTTAAPPLLAGLTVSDNRLFGWNGSRVYNSKPDSADRWGAFDFTIFDESDGDFITAVIPGRTALGVLKNRKRYNLYSDFSRPEFVGSWGCVAPLSVVPAQSGYFYMGDEGVYFESEGQNLERTVQSGLVSDKLRNFLVQRQTVKKNTVGAYIPSEQKVLFSIPYRNAGTDTTADTTYVYDMRAGGAWSTWTGFDIRGWALYDTATTRDPQIKDGFYFFSPGSSTLKRYRDSTTAGGFLSYQHVPITAGSPKRGLVTGAWIWGGGSGSLLSMQTWISNEANTTVSVTEFWTDMLNRYRSFEISSKPSVLNRINIAGDPGVAVTTGLYIDGIDLFISPDNEEVQPE